MVFVEDKVSTMSIVVFFCMEEIQSCIFPAVFEDHDITLYKAKLSFPPSNRYFVGIYVLKYYGVTSSQVHFKVKQNLTLCHLFLWERIGSFHSPMLLKFFRKSNENSLLEFPAHNPWDPIFQTQSFWATSPALGYLSRATSGPEFCVIWLRKMPASGWGSLWESSSFVPWFSTLVFRNVPQTVPECVCIWGFKRTSSNLDRAPKMRDSVLLNSWDSFLVTLPLISSENSVIYSSLILGTDVFRDWPFLGCSPCVSLVSTANFRLFLHFAIFLKGKCYAVMKTELVFIC